MWSGKSKRHMNIVCMEGNVGSVTHNKTNSGTPACSFYLATERESGMDPVWNRINVYGNLAVFCKSQLIKGDHVVIHGEIMNRPLSGSEDLMMCDIRGHKIIFVDARKTKRGEEYDD